jgi:diaminopimelate epimerase
MRLVGQAFIYIILGKILAFDMFGLYMQPMVLNAALNFHKMHGLGNDFVIIDRRGAHFELPPRLICAIADRHRGVGFDQLALIENSASHNAQVVFYNSDGSTSGACGNATRCIAQMIMQETGQNRITLATERGSLQCEAREAGLVAVNMGQPLLDWSDIPLAREMDTLHLPLPGEPTATGMGNPHCTFFVDDALAIALEEFGPQYEHSPLFPERTNVQVAQILSPTKIRMRVWERGAGVTLASGSSSCATAVAAVRRGLVERDCEILLDGGSLSINWAEDGVWMTGPTSHVFSGTFTPEFLTSL